MRATDVATRSWRDPVGMDGPSGPQVRALAATRLAVGLGVLLAPPPVVRLLVGEATPRRTVTALRLLIAGRDVAVGVGTLRSGRDAAALLRTGAACDAADALAVVLARSVLPVLGRRAVLASALTGMTAHLVVARRVASGR